MHLKHLYQSLLLGLLLLVFSVATQAQWGKIWDRAATVPAARTEAPLVEQRDTGERESEGTSLHDLLERQKNAIVGSWLLTVNSGGPPLRALASFTGDGIFLSTAQGDVTTNPQAPVVSPIHGVWAHRGGRQFRTSHVEIGYSAQTGELIGTLELQQLITLSRSGDEWNSTFHFTLFDPDGKAVFSGDGTIQAKRIKIRP